LEKDHGQSLQGSAKQFLEYIVTGATRMNNLLAALRDYMQVTDAGNQELTPVDSGQCLERALSNLQSAIDSSSAIITAGSLPMVMSVPVLLVQVFQNLVSNAIKYSGNGAPPRIHVSGFCQGSECVLSVQDNGIGIDPSYHERVFGVFKRLHADGGGTGIGLAICKASVERWGGRIWLESTPGAGSTFKFTAASAKGAS
jgi:light-regulated signal transduction histidine kinase (bacteriophytochrome)